MAPCKVVLLACGSFNPPTNMHLRMFGKNPGLNKIFWLVIATLADLKGDRLIIDNLVSEVARDHLNRLGQHKVIGGIISPVHDSYGKKELESSAHRIEMLRLALNTSDWVKVSDWESSQEGWSRTIQVLQYHQNTLNSCLYSNNNQRNDPGWLPEAVKGSDGPVLVKLLCGADLLETFSVPGLWKESDIETIVGVHGLVVITREGANPLRFVYESDQLTRHMGNIFVVTEWITNDVSSTKIRRALRRQESVRYLLPDSVVDYICENGLYGSQKKTTDVNMRSVSPSKADTDITLSLAPIDVPDGKKEESKRRAFFKNETEVVFYPGQSSRVLPIDDNPSKMKKVGFVDEVKADSNPKKLITSYKQTAEVQKIVLEGSPKKVKKPARLSDPTRSRNVFKRSNSDISAKSANSLEATPVKIEFTKDGVKVISDKESIV